MKSVPQFPTNPGRIDELQICGQRAEKHQSVRQKMADLRRIAAFFSFFGPQPDSSIKFAGD